MPASFERSLLDQFLLDQFFQPLKNSKLRSGIEELPKVRHEVFGNVLATQTARPNSDSKWEVIILIGCVYRIVAVRSANERYFAERNAT
jgi:hypothetical protein